MWNRFIPAQVVGRIDVAALVAASSGFSPADIEFAARSASQRALEKAMFDAVRPGRLRPTPVNPSPSAGP